MHIKTHIVAEERNKNNTNGKITMMNDKREKRKCTYIFTSLKSQEDNVAPEKNGLIILVEIGVFVLRRKKMGQWAGISRYNKTS